MFERKMSAMSSGSRKTEEHAQAAVDEPLPPEEIHQEDGRLEHPRVAYERSNAPLGAVLGIMAFVICFACAHYWAAREFFQGLEAHEEQQKRSHLVPALRPDPALPARPRLEQIDRFADIETPNINRRMSVNEAALGGYGETDEDGYVRVPIERAMEQLVGRTPVRKQPSTKQKKGPVRDQGLINAGDSNSGRMFRGRR
jgi:hypothetical protein